jgi:hypothetical protein
MNQIRGRVCGNLDCEMETLIKVANITCNGYVVSDSWIFYLAAYTIAPELMEKEVKLEEITSSIIDFAYKNI